MPTALFAFDRREDASEAMRRLIDDAGFRQGALQLHVHDEIAPDAAGELDEVVTGGFLHSFSRLWQGVFESDIAPNATNPYAEAIRRGGAALRVEADDEAACARADAAMAEMRAAASSGWRESGSTS